ncbi:MAG: lysophospholipid acyltransferase family protein [Myxococcales bacterium]|nr:lysophospholipid acyltransferase family protein [Myxococcales bacterium]
MKPRLLSTLLSRPLGGSPTLHQRAWFALVSRGGLAFFRHACAGQILGEEHVTPVRDGFVLASNHVSYLDWIVLWEYFNRVHNIQLTFLAKKKLLDHPALGTIVEQAQCVMVSDDGKHLVDRTQKQRLDRCRYIAVFPEGTRSRDGVLGAANPGVIRIAGRLRLPILPVGLRGFYGAWPPYQALPTPVRCSIHVGPSLAAEGEEAVALGSLMSAIAGLSGQAQQ